jgi:hypothetical protein
MWHFLLVVPSHGPANTAFWEPKTHLQKCGAPRSRGSRWVCISHHLNHRSQGPT